MRWPFYSRMIGRNKYLDCLFSLDNTFKNYIMDKYHPVCLSNHSVKNAVWLYFEHSLCLMSDIVFFLHFFFSLHSVANKYIEIFIDGRLKIK